MKSKLLIKIPKTFVLVFDKGDEVTAILLGFARENQLKASYFTALGSFSDAVLGFFERERKDYKRIEMQEQVEVMSLFGNIARDESGEHKLHAHVVVGKSDGSGTRRTLTEGACVAHPGIVSNGNRGTIAAQG